MKLGIFSLVLFYGSHYRRLYAISALISWSTRFFSIGASPNTFGRSKAAVIDVIPLVVGQRKLGSGPEWSIKTWFHKISKLFIRCTIDILMTVIYRLSGSEIRDFAFIPIGQRENSFSKELLIGNLAAANIGLAVSSLRNKRARENTELRVRFHLPRSLTNIYAVCSGITNEAWGIDDFRQETGAHVRATGLLMFHKNCMGH